MPMECPRCGARIRWVATRTGRRLPLDVEPLPGPAASGWLLDGTVARRADPSRDHSSRPRYRDHRLRCGAAPSLRAPAAPRAVS